MTEVPGLRDRCLAEADKLMAAGLIGGRLSQSEVRDVLANAMQRGYGMAVEDESTKNVVCRGFEGSIAAKLAILTSAATAAQHVMESVAQNDHMIDNHYTDSGKSLMEASRGIRIAIERILDYWKKVLNDE